METSILIPTNNISRYLNEIVETIPDNEFKTPSWGYILPP
ncbi:transposase [Staphylococcus lugdunensis]|nr:mobile element protein [Staphylococcus lugdunensis]